MDRLSRIVTRGGLALVLGSMVSSLGCRSMKSEIPPGKPYSTTGAPTPNVGFSSDPHPNAGGAAGLYNNGVQQASGASGLPGGVQPASGDSVGNPVEMTGRPQYGTPINNKNSYTDAVPATGRYGPPGTSGISSPAPTQQPLPVPAMDSTTPEASKSPLQGALGVDLP